jgi:hypothetical protein
MAATTKKAAKAAANTAPEKGAIPAPEQTQELSLASATSNENRWLVERPKKRTGELQLVEKYKYLEGNPKQYRSDSKAGEFNLNGGAGIGDTFTFQPFAWRLFEDDILNSGLKQWFELFFMKDDCVCAIIFHGYSAENLVNMAAPLFYDDITLADVVITAKHVMHESKAKEAKKAKFSIVEFSYELAEEALVEELDDYAKEHRIFRRSTLTSKANFEAVHNYYNPLEEEGDSQSEEEGTEDEN